MKKLKKFKLFEDRIGFEDIDEPLKGLRIHNIDDDNFSGEEEDDEIREMDEDEFSQYNGEEEDEEEEEEEEGGENTEDDDMEYLCYLIRQIFINNGITPVITYREFDIEVDIQLKRRETLNNLINIFEIVKKIQDDMLVNYDTQYEVYETKKESLPILTFEFTLTQFYDPKNGPDPVKSDQPPKKDLGKYIEDEYDDEDVSFGYPRGGWDEDAF